MSIFDLLLLLVAFSSVIALLVVLLLAVFGRRRRAKQTFLYWLTAIGVYMVVVLISSLTTPRREFALGDELCFDDWCIAIENVTPTEAENETVYVVKFRMFSTARAITQREKNLAIYLADATGRRFDPVERDGDVPLNVPLGPGHRSRPNARSKFRQTSAS